MKKENCFFCGKKKEIKWLNKLFGKDMKIKAYFCNDPDLSCINETLKHFKDDLGMITSSEEK